MSKKAERRRARHEKNVVEEKEYKKEAWTRGKLIEENHNGGPYSPEYTRDISSRLVTRISNAREDAYKTDNPNASFLVYFRALKRKIQDTIIHWNPIVPKFNEYHFLKGLLEIYWDEVLANGNDAVLLAYVNTYLQKG